MGGEGGEGEVGAVNARGHREQDALRDQSNTARKASNVWGREWIVLPTTAQNK